MKKHIIILFWLVISNNVISQNLIPNSSFERALDDPEIVTSDNNFTCSDWESPSSGTPDYFKGSRQGLFKSGDNLFGNIEPYDGESYIGFGSNMGGQHFFEYISTELVQPLSKGESYCLTMFVSAANKIEHFTTNEIDFVFTNTSIYESSGSRLKPLNYEKCTIDSGYIVSGNWNRISACYIAKGGEKFLTIGIFNQNYKHFNLTNNKEKRFDGVYLYIDDVSLVPIRDTSECKCNELEVISNYDRALGKPIVVKNINFENNSAKLLPSSNKELDKLVNYLKSNLSYKIELIGHTDSIGKEKDNVKLSGLRAKSVAEYFLVNGIAKSRVSYRGEGSKFPLKPNNREENRLMNRRVEFKISK
mgnify:CR=1 FL=1